MSTENEIKEMVKEKYKQIVLQADVKKSSCGCGCSGKSEFSMINEDYSKLDGYVAEADLNLGCGVPTNFANIKLGDVVLDLGSGAGNDVFVTRQLVGDGGKVIGVDMTQEMIDKANKNKDKLGAANVEFKLGEIESLPVTDSSIDVVISNCVLNLVPNKDRAFSEIYRVLKPKAHFCVSDIVLKGTLPQGLKESATMYAGCVAGALQEDEYINVIKKTGFTDVKIVKNNKVSIPVDMLAKYLTKDEINNMESFSFGIYSITVTAEK